MGLVAKRLAAATYKGATTTVRNSIFGNTTRALPATCPLESTTTRRHFSSYDSISIKVDLKESVRLVRAHDPAGYLPGRLLPSKDAQVGYFAVRAFWIATGLRMTKLADSMPDGSRERIEWWQERIDELYSNQCHEQNLILPPEGLEHASLRLIQEIRKRHKLSKEHFDSILAGRRSDIDLKQYPTLSSLEEHANQSCGKLLQLVMQCSDVSSEIAHQAAEEVGMVHGLTNALRTSIPVISTTGKLIIPEDLCIKYGVKSPRYLLSALGMGDEKCRHALQHAIGDIVQLARQHLNKAREKRVEILQQPDGKQTVVVLLPGLSSETFLNRLERSGNDLTDRNLRNVGFLEHMACAGRTLSGFIQKTY